jgi:hypothetical protein
MILLFSAPDKSPFNQFLNRLGKITCLLSNLLYLYLLDGKNNYMVLSLKNNAGNNPFAF